MKARENELYFIIKACEDAKKWGGGEARDMPARRKFFSGNGIFYSNMLYTERLECECKSIFQHNHFNMTGNVPQSACLQNLHVHF